MKAHLVGGGIASLAAAAHLIKDGNMLGGNIHVYEAGDGIGGCLRGYGDAAHGYVIPVGRVFEKQYRCTAELLSFIPSVSDPSRSVWEEMEEFHQKAGWHNKTRLVGAGGRVIDASDFGLSLVDKLAMTRLLLTPEALLEGLRIDEWFSPAMFSSNFWYMWVPVMGSLPQHSLLEMKRFLNRFLHLLPDFAPMTMIYRTRYHQDQAIRQPLQEWLARQGVNFHVKATVKDVDFVPSLDHITAQGLVVEMAGTNKTIEVARDDIVLVTNGSQVGDVNVGSMDLAPSLHMTGNAWRLWQRLSRGRKDFGNPNVFFGKPEDSLWGIFTVTTGDPTFMDRFAAFTGRPTGRQGLVTLVDSNWLLTIVTFHQPHFREQPEGIQIWWGYGVYPDRPGNFVAKPMRECSGAEILREVLGHLAFDSDAERIVATSNCIPCLVPEANALWAVRRRADRPLAVPTGSTNFGFIGQFCEVADDVVFTMEYSVRSAREAVTKLLRLDRKPPAPYQGLHDPAAIQAALGIMMDFPKLPRRAAEAAGHQ
jgi:oleate hydratase